MRPLHGEITRLSGRKSECGFGCCRMFSRFAKHRCRNRNNGKSSVRGKVKRDIQKEV